MSSEPNRPEPSGGERPPAGERPIDPHEGSRPEGLPRLFGEMLSRGPETNPAGEQTEPAEPTASPSGSGARRPHRMYRKPTGTPRASFTASQRLLILDAWQRSSLAGTDFAPLVNLSVHTLYEWKRRFEEAGPAGLEDGQRGAPVGSRMPEPTRRAVLMMKKAHPEWGCERLHDMLVRSRGLSASAGAIARVLREEGYETEELPTAPHAPQVQRFERARPNQLWQTDLFTFILKRQNRRVWLVAFMDDHSRFIVGYGLHASASGAMVREVLQAAIANFGAPEEVLTDNGTQYHTWRGVSAFTELLNRRGVRHIVATPRHPQTLGKVERFWGTLWRECVEAAIFEDLTDARRRIGLFIDHYNFQRTHAGIEGLVPADRFFGAAPQVLEALRARVAANAAELARHGVPRKSFYLAGQVGDESIALHGEGGRVVLTRDGKREEVDLSHPGMRQRPGDSATLDEPVAVTAPQPAESTAEPAAVPGHSELDDALSRLQSYGLRPAAGSDPSEGGRS